VLPLVLALLGFGMRRVAIFDQLVLELH